MSRAQEFLEIFGLSSKERTEKLKTIQGNIKKHEAEISRLKRQDSSKSRASLNDHEDKLKHWHDQLKKMPKKYQDQHKADGEKDAYKKNSEERAKRIKDGEDRERKRENDREAEKEKREQEKENTTKRKAASRNPDRGAAARAKEDGENHRSAQRGE